MADKLTQHITDALSKAAAEPAGLPLYAGKAEPGLFPSATASRPAAQKCLSDGFLRVIRTEPHGKAAREWYGITEKGWEFLLAALNPRQVLEDFVRVLEARQGEVSELLATARHMAESLHGLKDAVARVLPQVLSARIEVPVSREPEANAVPTALPKDDLAAAILACLADWSTSTHAAQDCPLPELFHQLPLQNTAITIGQFHDSLRKLHAAGALYLHPWTGPLYALPEPTLALLTGHNISYYASAREAGIREREFGGRYESTSVLSASH